jgi:signal transduction histidine kinase/F0F1-type ATP synthase membrane subunit b/b'
VTSRHVISGKPPLALSTAVLVSVVVVWAAIRLWWLAGHVAPLTFVLPLLMVVWSRRRWQLWTMAGVFWVLAYVKVYVLLPATVTDGVDRGILFGITCLNVLVGAIVVHFILKMREALELKNALIAAQHAEVEQQAEELAQQNEEITQQSEELTQQGEELEAQTEELERQNWELQEINTRLVSRETVLSAILDATRASDDVCGALDEVCRRTLEIIDDSVAMVAMLEVNGDTLQHCGLASHFEHPARKTDWPIAGSLAGVVLKEHRTAYVDDLAARPDLAAPFGADGPVRSLLMSPVHLGREEIGVLVLCRREPGHWTREEFRFAEWLAAQFALVLQGVRYQEQLEKRTAEVETANRKKDEFLAMLSHELRTPLTPVLAASGAMAEDPRLPEDAREELAMISRNVAVQSRLIDDLLDLAKLGKGKLTLHPQVLNLPSLLRETARIVASDLDAKELRLDLHLDLPPDASVEGDGARLQQVIWNLLRNAIKFSPSDGRIELRARLDESNARRAIIEVVDHGSGIDPADLDRIFQPFEQAANPQHNGEGQGLGLGLCIARAIVKMHEGTVRAHSDGIGHGATMTVELPMCEPAPARLTPDPRPTIDHKSNGRSSSPRILFVEDHEDTARLLVRYLGSQGYDVQHAPNAAGAIAAAQGGRFDMIISDLGLPDGNGITLMRALREMHPALTGVCLSGYGMESDVAASREAGFTEHLIKPIELSQLQAAIKRVLAVSAG